LLPLKASKIGMKSITDSSNESKVIIPPLN